MKQDTKRRNMAKTALFGASLIWGSSFIIVKSSMDVMGPHTLLGFRFTIACILLSVIFHKRLKNLNRDYFKKGAIIGVLIFLAYSLQTIGITDTTPGKNAFLTAIYCVIVPYLYWIVDRNKPDIYNFMAAFVGITGIGLVSLNESLTIGFGDTFTLISGFFYAGHMVAVAKFGRDKDPVLITILQFGYAAILSWIVALFYEDIPTSMDAGAIASLLYLAVFATAVALLLQNIGQKYTNPAPASIIMSLESVFGIIFSILFYGEEVTPKLLSGFVFIFIAIILSETKLSFIKKKGEAMTGDISL